MPEYTEVLACHYTLRRWFDDVKDKTCLKLQGISADGTKAEISNGLGSSRRLVVSSKIGTLPAFTRSRGSANRDLPPRPSGKSMGTSLAASGFIPCQKPSRELVSTHPLSLGPINSAWSLSRSLRIPQAGRGLGVSVPHCSPL